MPEPEPLEVESFHPDAHDDAAVDPDEIEHVKARLARDAEQEVERKTRDVLVSLLDVVDDLDRALANAEASGEADRALLEGVEMVRKGFLDKLAAHGVTRATKIGDAFDPTQHEALAIAPPQKPADEGAVMAIVRPGYNIAGEVLRPAGVVVGKRA